MNDRTTPRAPLGEIPDTLLLAAVSRAALHRPRPGVGAPLRALLEHLGIAGRSAAVRAVRAGLERLEAAGEVNRSREHGVTMWSLSAAGERRLDAALAGTDPPPLPESPQHAAWRRARTAAAQEIGRFCDALRVSLRDCEELLERAERQSAAAPSSDAWFRAGTRLHGGCRRVGAASYCLREWEEPSDERPDHDDLSVPGDAQLEQGERLRALRSGRRNIALWREPG